MNKHFEKYTDKETFSKIVDYTNVTEMWNHSVSTYPDNVAIVDGEEFTYSRLNEEVSGFRSIYRNNGIQPGSLIAILCPNSIGFVKAFLAAATYALPAVLLPAHLDKETIFGISYKFGLKAVVYDEAFEEKVPLVKERLPGVALITSSASSDESTPAIPVPGKTPCAFLFTGGTTGKSKGARLSHQAIMP